LHAVRIVIFSLPTKRHQSEFSLSSPEVSVVYEIQTMSLSYHVNDSQLWSSRKWTSIFYQCLQKLCTIVNQQEY